MSVKQLYRLVVALGFKTYIIYNSANASVEATSHHAVLETSISAFTVKVPCVFYSTLGLNFLYE